MATVALAVAAGVGGSADAVELRVTTQPAGTLAVSPGDPVTLEFWLVLAPGETVRRAEFDLTLLQSSDPLALHPVADLLGGVLPHVPWGQEAVFQQIGSGSGQIAMRYGNAADLDLAGLAVLVNEGLLLDADDALPLGSVDVSAQGSGWISVQIDSVSCSNSGGPSGGPVAAGLVIQTGVFVDDGSGCVAQGLADADGDGLCDPLDLCPAWATADNSDSDGNGIGNECECGDASGDGTVNVEDIFALQNLILDGTSTALCDTNDDDVCNLLDAFGIQAKALGAPAWCARYPMP